MTEKLKYFALAKELNDTFHDLLIENKVHFRASLKSFSLISVSQEKPELGTSCKISKYKSEDKRKDSVIEDIDKIKIKPLPPPSLSKPEKELQAWIINYSLNNNFKLPFGNYTFLTSELAFPTEERKRGYVNDILAVDDKNTLIIIELKSSRTNKVKIQAIEYEEKVINKNMALFHELVTLMLGVKWNGETKKVSVWPYNSGNTKRQEYLDVEELNYSQVGNNYTFQ
jgi:hypothetical protein